MPPPEDVIKLVRKFANNSYRYLFCDPANAAELLRWREPQIARRISFEKLTVLPETFVTADFAALETDVLLKTPFRLKRGASGMIEVFILIEHQSEPDERMIFRLIRYVMLIYERQVSDWLKTHANLRGFEFDPVWPLVFYSGTRSWTKIEPMRELVRGGKLFEKRLPHLEPDFINLSTITEEELQNKIGTLGWILWLFQQRKQKADDFRDVLARVVERIDDLPTRSSGRWEHLLWYAHALIYHVREGDERQQMVEFIRKTVQMTKQAEVEAMGKTIAEVIKEEGFLEGVMNSKRETLMRQLQLKFKRVPQTIEAEINATQDIKKLAGWLDEVVVAKHLSDIGFSSRS